MTSAIDALRVDASRLGDGRGELELTVGIDTELGAVADLDLIHRFDRNWYAGLRGQAAYGLTGPSRDRISGAVIGLLGAEW